LGNTKTVISRSFLNTIWSGLGKGKLGALLAATMEIKENGLEDMIRRIRKEFPK
jgi:uncharacterized protein (DUF3820 family)